jgi:hypothetical protein
MVQCLPRSVRGFEQKPEITPVKKTDDFGEGNGRIAGDPRDCQLRTRVGRKIKINVVRVVSDLRRKVLTRWKLN